MNKRYYHYTGSACNEVAEFDSLAEAIKSARGDFVFDSKTRQQYKVSDLERDLDALEQVLLQGWAEGALNAAIEYVQRQLGVPSGDNAENYFKGERIKQIEGLLKQYIIHEVETMEGEA